jgi:hypothetical protein
MNRTMIARRTFATIAAVAVGSVCLLLNGVRPAQADLTKTTLVFGPLMVAMVDGYGKWVAGPLGGKVPDAAAFKTTVDATSDPYVITFAATAGHSLQGGTYKIPQADVLHTNWPSVPAAYVPKFPKGPITLTGSYSRAFISAYYAHEKVKKTLGDAYAYGTSSGSGVAISTVTDKNSAILVGFAQKYKQTTKKIYFGCYKEQQYLVNATTFKAASSKLGCPG